jgi:hypothetical protein
VAIFLWLSSFVFLLLYELLAAVVRGISRWLAS